MKDEIKEILNSIQEHLKENEENFKKGAVDSTVYYLYCDDARTLLDYITNLQDTLKDREEYCYGLETSLTNLQEELKSANESITWWQNRFNAIQQENERLKEIEKEHKNCTRKHWQQKCAEHCANEMIYKSRNEKAIEYIYEHREEALFEYNGKLVYALSDNFDEGDLLNILQGEDKE